MTLWTWLDEEPPVFGGNSHQRRVARRAFERDRRASMERLWDRYRRLEPGACGGTIRFKSIDQKRTIYDATRYEGLMLDPGMIVAGGYLSGKSWSE